MKSTEDRLKLKESYTGGGRLLKSVLGYSNTIGSLANLKQGNRIEFNERSFVVGDVLEKFILERNGRVEQNIRVFLIKRD